MPFVWATFLEDTAHRQPFFADFLRDDASRHSRIGVPIVKRPSAPSSLAEQSSSASASRNHGLLHLVLGLISTWTGGPVDPNMPLTQAGLDSLGAPASHCRQWLYWHARDKHLLTLTAARRP